MLRFLSNVYLLLFIGFLFFTSCNRVPDRPWKQAVPENAILVHVVPERVGISEYMGHPFIGFLENTGVTYLSDIREVEAAISGDLRVRSAMVLPVDANSMSVVWATEGNDETAETIGRFFERPFMENQYRFNGVTIHILRLNRSDKIAYLASAGSNIYLSLNSFALESALRSYLGKTTPFVFDSPPQSGSVYFNNSSAEFLVSSMGAVRFRPLVSGIFKNSGTSILNIDETGISEGRSSYQITANLNPESERNFIHNTTTENFRPVLDRFIPADAAIVGIFSEQSTIDFAEKSPTTALDSTLYNQPNLVDLFQTYLQPETAFAGYHTLGFSPLEETIYLRRVSNPELVRTELDRLVNRGLINQINQNYGIRSSFMAQLLGGSLCPYTDFYAGFVEDVLILTPRNGLIQRVRNDYSRRRVMHFDENYTDAKNNHPASLSAFLYADSRTLTPFIQPYIDPVSNAENVLGLFDLLTLSFENQSNEVEWQLNTHSIRRATMPFADRWFFPLDEHELTGPATIANLTGGNRDEIIFATTGNRVIALASDGTEIFRAGTGDDIPIGSPVIFDWYQNNQQAVLIGAGDKIYAWNNRGELLPNFPFKLSEQISAPITVSDVTRSGFPEIVVPTIDRNLNVIDRRGFNADGWPQSTNSTIRSQVVVENFENEMLLIASAENALFGWRRNGQLQDGFPVFAEAPLSGSPIVSGNNIISGAGDGHVYVFSSTPLFDTELAPLNAQGSLLGIQKLNVSSNSLWVSDIRTIRSAAGGQSFNSEAIVSYSTDGAVFIHDMNGNLVFSESMGQSMAGRHTLLIADLNRDNFPELITVSNFGSMFAWSLQSGDRFSGIPSNAVHHPIASRIRGDASTYIIAGTREGLRAWAITN